MTCHSECMDSFMISMVFSGSLEEIRKNKYLIQNK